MSGVLRSSVILTLALASVTVGCAERPGKRKETAADKDKNKNKADGGKADAAGKGAPVKSAPPAESAPARSAPPAQSAPVRKAP